MKKFSLKFLIISTVFFGLFFYYRFYVVPNISGDIGRLGMIPFGNNYHDSILYCHRRDLCDDSFVVDVTDADSLKHYDVITIGDSFSARNINGYQQSLGSEIGHKIANFRFGDYHPVEDYLILLNNNYIEKGTTVVLESVERSFVDRFSKIDSLESLVQLPDNQVKNVTPSNVQSLNSFLSWIRLSIGYDKPIKNFTLSKKCFSHKRFQKTLFIYDNKKFRESDLGWELIRDDQYDKAIRNIYKIIDYSLNRGINIIIMIACDKYDAYEPWINVPHEKNPLLDNLPACSRIYNSRDCLRNAIDNGVKDIYLVNDTHWSVVGADIVGKDLHEWINKSELL